jgi:hypothetical protein
MTSSILNVSLSAIQSFRQCEQQYAYRYVERLRRRDKAKPLEFGSMLHTYLEIYYGHILEGEKPRDAHEFSKVSTSSFYTPEIKRMAKGLFMLRHDEQAQELLDLLPAAGRIADRYFLTRGESDAEEYEILYVEEPIEVNLGYDIQTRGKVDMVTRHKASGRIHLWEHKSTSNEPSAEYRLRDLQTTLYASNIKTLNLLDEEIDAIMWNYIRTQEPTIPRQLKNGELTRDKRLDSTWEVYAAQLNKYKLDPREYEEQRQRLQGREESIYFRRHEHVLLASAKTLLRDYLRTARDIKAKRRLWAAKKRVPVRNLSLGCDWCEFKDLCNAALFAGSDRDARGRFTQGS